MTLSLERLLERGPAFLDDITSDPTLSASSRERLMATLGYALPVLEAPAPQRVGRLHDLLAFSEDPALERLAAKWGEAIGERTPWVASLVPPEARPADWPHRLLGGSNPRVDRLHARVGLDDGPSCRIASLATGEVLATLPGRLLAIEDAIVLTQERGCVCCIELTDQGPRERWRNPSVPQAMAHAALAKERTLLLGGGHLHVLSSDTGRPIALHQREGMRGLLRAGERAWLVTERALHAVGPDGETHPIFETEGAIAASTGNEHQLFVTEYWDRIVALDAVTYRVQWSAPVRAQHAGLALSRDGERVAVCSAKSTDPVVSIFDARDGSGRVELAARGHASHAAFDASGSRLFVNGAVFDVASGARLGVLAGRGGPAHSVQATDDGAHLVALSPRGVVRFAGAPSIERSVHRQAQPAWRAVLFGEEILTDGSATGFERWSLNGAFLEARSEQLVGVVGHLEHPSIVVEHPLDAGGQVEVLGREGDRWVSRYRTDGASAWCARGLDGFVVHRRGEARFEVRDAAGALRFEGAGQVRAALSAGLVVERDGQSFILDPHTGEARASLGTAIHLPTSEGDALAYVRAREHDASLEVQITGTLRWSTAIPKLRAGTALAFEEGQVVLTRTDLDPGTERAVVQRAVFDRETGALRGETERVDEAGPGMTTTRLGPLEARVIGGTTSVWADGVLIATLPVPLELAELGERTLLIGPRGPAIYEVRGRLRSTRS